MTINVKVGKKDPKQDQESGEKPVIARVELDMRRSLNGDIMIFDHADIDIVLSISTNKVIAFAKDIMSDLVYGAQDRLFSFLSKKGLVSRGSIQAGAVYGSMEGNLIPGIERDSFRMVIINMSKWIDEERPYFEFVEEFDDLTTDRFTEPNDEDSTELGEVPHEEMKGTLRPGYNYGPYWQNYSY